MTWRLEGYLVRPPERFLLIKSPLSSNLRTLPGDSHALASARGDAA
jgi:hypothetical protein